MSSYDSVVDYDREEARSASYDAPDYDDDRPTLAECQQDEADAGPYRPPSGPYTCTDPWCPSRVITPAHLERHASEGCTACSTGQDCTFLVLWSQEPHQHGAGA